MPREKEDVWQPGTSIVLNKIKYDAQQLLDGHNAARIHRQLKQRAHRNTDNVLSTPEAFDSICEQTAYGIPIHTIAEAFRVNVMVMLDYIDEDPHRKARYRRARNASADLIRTVAVDVAQAAKDDDDDLNLNERRLLVKTLNELADSRRHVEPVEQSETHGTGMVWAVPTVDDLLKLHESVDNKRAERVKTNRVLDHDTPE